MKVIPSILTSSAKDSWTQVQNLLPYYSRFQVDIADGNYVPNTTCQIDELQKYFLDNAIKFPREVSFDFHLMVEDYEADMKKLVLFAKYITIKVIFVHVSLNFNYEKLSAQYSPFLIGLVLNPEDDVAIIKHKYDFSKIDNIQIMAIHPGMQGSSFMPETLQKIEQLRAANYRSSIFLDGAVNEHTLPIILEKKYKPDFICPGSYFSRAANVEEKVKKIENTIRHSGKR
ncbi:MAG: hypothetical protein Q7S61_05505 [bacterium]|nr:hypothetical protein [bacterium]